MTKRTIFTLVASAALLGFFLWPGVMTDSVSDGALTQPRLLGIFGAAFLGLASLRRSEG